MTQSQLKVRLVQMARDLEERTKWEAVRLQEFLSMKEKEVEDRYLLLIKKLRLEAEQLQEEKLAEQKKVLTAQTEEVINEQKN
jgi:mitofilin